MADISNLSNFLTDIASAIRNKKGTTEPIPAQEFDSEIAGIMTGIDTSDATATSDDIINPKTAYVNGEKLEGSIIPTYAEEGEITTTQNSNISKACDVRQDLGFYLKIENNAVSVYSLENGALQQVINSGFVITSNTLYDAKFSRAPISAGSSIYNIILLGAKLRSSTVDVTTGVARFDTKNPTVVKEYFACSTTNGGDNGGRFGSYGFTIVENDNYVYSTIKCYSNYYKSWTGNNELLYINNDAKTITRRCEFGGIGAAGLVPQMTDDHRIILVNCPNHLQLSRVNDNNSGITAITSYTPSTTNPRLVLTDDGYFYLDKGYYNTNRELLHSYASLPWEYNDVVLWCNGYLVRFNNTSTVRVYSFDKDTFEIKMEKSFETNGVPNIKYYNTGVSNHYAMTINDYPEANGSTIAFSTANGVYYVLYLDVENLRLDSVEIKGIGYYNTSSVDTAADRLLTGNTMFTSEGVVKGTMPNNGELTYTPSEEEQTIPAGYTSGGKVQAVDITSLDDYQDCLNIAKTIINIQEPTDKLCEYIESTGSSTQITTDIYVDEMAETVDVTISNPSLNGWAYIIAIGSTRIAEFDSSTFGCWHQNTRSDFRATVVSSTPYILTFTNGAILQNEVTKLSYSKLTSPNSQLLKLFPKFDTASYSRIHKIQIKRADLVIHDLVPVLHIVNDTYMPCIYDKITGKYYFNDYSGNFNYKLAE